MHVSMRPTSPSLPPSLARSLSLSLSLSRSWYREVQADDGGYPSKLTAMSGYGIFSPSFVSNWIEQPQKEKND